MNNFNTVYKRELYSYFTQPTAYAIIFIFLLLSMGLTFTFGSFMRLGDANLQNTFFLWHPFIFMILAPAVAMGLWSDEQRNGTIELLGTYPISSWTAILAKYLASTTVWIVALVCTFPVWITVNVLGEPDNWTIFSGYIGSFLTCAVFLAVTALISAFTRDQVVCLIVSVTACVFMVLIGYDPVVMEFEKVFGTTMKKAGLAVGVWDHYTSLTRGAFRLQDFTWFVSLIAVSLVGTNVVLNAKRA